MLFRYCSERGLSYILMSYIRISLIPFNADVHSISFMQPTEKIETLS